MIPTLLAAAALFPAQAPKATTHAAATAQTLAERLAEKVDAPAGIEGKFRDVGEKLANRFNLPLVIGPEWKKRYESGESEEPTVKLPALAGVRLGTLLRVYAEMGDGTVLVHPDTLRLKPETAAWYESGILAVGEDDSGMGKLLSEEDLQRNRPLASRALLTKEFKDRTLREILADIAATTGATVVLAPTAQKAVGINDPDAFKLTAAFANTPVDAAVRTLADMSDLAVFADANVLLVTTPEKVRQRYEAVREKRQILNPPQNLGLGIAGGFGCGGVAVGGASYRAPMPAAADKTKDGIAAVQKQAAEVQKQMAESQKSK